MRYSPNPAVNQTIEALLALGCPPIPVAPKQNPRNPGCHRVVGKKDEGFCPVDKNLQPIPKFTGKNPSYLKRDGSAEICKHGEFQTRLPSTTELKRFFCHPDTGVGTLGGHAGVVWVDFDAKNYQSQEACDSDVEGIIARKKLHNTWIERTGSGGWRIALKPRQKPTFTNFATSPDGQHVGEALFKGRFTVLAPSIHPNGNAYRRVGWGTPIEVESLEDSDCFPSKDEVEQAERKQRREKRKASNPHYGQPTNPQDNPWDIRNFAHYFEGYHERSDGWAYAKCPHHNGTSQTSFRVRLDTGEFKLWCGCNTKDVYKSGLELAKAQGYRVPEKAEKDPKISRDLWEVKHGFGKFLKSKLTKVFKGFGDRPEPRTRRLQMQVSSDGVIEFQPGERLKTTAKLRSLRWKYILDRSGTGSGKSHEAGMVHPDPDSGGKVWYLSANHRNPTVETVEEMTDLPPRHNGQVIEAGKFTAKGNPHIRNLRKGEDPNSVERTPGNCHQAELFSALKAKGLDPDQEQADGRNAICGKCPALFNCVQSGFLGQRKEALKARRIRAHIDSLPLPITLSESGGYDYSGDIAFVDEADQLLRGVRKIKASKNEVAAFWALLERKAPDAFEALKPIRIALGRLLEGEFDKFFHGKNRGVDHERLMDNLPDPDFFPNIFELIAQVQEASPKLADLIVEADSVTGLGGKWRDAGYSLRSQFRREATLETLTNILNAPTNILIYLLKIWAGLKQGSLRCHHGELIATVQDGRTAAILREFGCVVLLSATADKRVLAAKLGVDPDEIVEIRQASPKPNNLTVVNVQMPGMGSNEVSDACKQRQVKLLNAIRSRHEGQSVKVLANKSDIHLPLDGYWFRDNRGSNEFIGTDVLVAFNTPRPNWGAIEDEYRAIFGSLEGFEEYYQHLIASEIVQLIGRPRANLYPDKQITIYIVGTGLDLEFLKEYGVKLQTVEAYQICPEAGTAAQITRWKIKEAARIIIEQGGKLTQTAIGEKIGKSQELISKISQDFGGWKRLKKLLLALLQPYRDGNNFSGLSEEERWLAESYLPAVFAESPEVAAEQLGQLIRTQGWGRFLLIVTAASPQTQARVLGLIFQALPQCLPELVISEARLVPS